MKDPSDVPDEDEEKIEEYPGSGRWDGQPEDLVIHKRSEDEANPRSKFEWRPEDVVILQPGDPGYDDDSDE